MDLYASLRDLGVIHIDVENLVTYDSRTRSDPGLMKLDAAKEVGQASRGGDETSARDVRGVTRGKWGPKGGVRGEDKAWSLGWDRRRRRTRETLRSEKKRGIGDGQHPVEA